MQRRAEAHSGDAVPIQVVRGYRDEEISLTDLWLVIHRRWQWLLAGLLAGVLGAVSQLVFSVPVYESSALVQIGKLTEAVPLDDVNALAARLMSQYGDESQNPSERRMPYLKQATVEGGNGGMLKLTSVGHSPQEARDLLEKIIAPVLRRHEEVYRSAVGPLRDRMKAIAREVQLMRTRAADLDQLIERLKESQPAQAALVAIQQGHLQEEVSQLERDRVQMLRQASIPFSKPSHMIARPTLVTSPVSPRVPVAIAIGLAAGVVLGLFAVFSAEAISNRHSHRK